MVRCTIYAQIFVPRGKDDVICMTPQWESNSKGSRGSRHAKQQRFSPRNGEVILKYRYYQYSTNTLPFQSPQWGSNSKGNSQSFGNKKCKFQSPQWGSNSKGKHRFLRDGIEWFQSPQWGSNSKGYPLESA